MSKRRIIVIVVILALMCGAGGLVWLYIYRNTGSRLLGRADFALNKGNWERARSLAQKYIDSEPDEWEGYYVLGKALIGDKDYGGGRKSLERAIEIAPRERAPVLSLADSYAAPAVLRRDNEMKREGKKDLKVIEDSVGMLEQAAKVLDRADPVKETHRLDVIERKGSYLMEAGRTHMMLAEVRRDLIKQLEALPTGPTRKKEIEEHKKQIDFHDARSGEFYKQAMDTLMGVLVKDPNRGDAAQKVYMISTLQNEPEIRKKVIKIIEAMKKPPAAAAAQILVDRIITAQKEGDPDYNKLLRDSAGKLDGLIKKYPKNVDLKVRRAQVALALSDVPTAESLCKDILKVNPQHAYARLVLAQVLVRRGEVTEAETRLFQLAAQYKRWDRAQLAYARVAKDIEGKKQLALKAVHAALELNPKSVEAKQLLAELLDASGQGEQAFGILLETTRANPDNPQAFLAYIRGAKNAKNNAYLQEARTALAQKEISHAQVPEMLYAVVAGYQLLDEKVKAKALIKTIAQITPTDSKGRLAVATAQLSLRQYDKAEANLVKELSYNPDNPVVCFRLAGLYMRGRRPRTAQAREMLRRAVELDGTKEEYRLALSRALLASGELREARSALEGVNADSVQGNLLRMYIDLAEGKNPDTSGMIQKLEAANQNPLQLALISLRTGKSKQCAEICRKQLADPDVKNPEGYRLLLAQALVLLGQPADAVAELKVVLKTQPNQPAVYRLLAKLLGQDMKWAPLRDAMKKIPSADPDQVDLAIGAMMLQQKRPDLAVAVLEQLAHQGQSEDQRNRGRILLAEALARSQKLDDAVEQLKPLKAKKEWRRQAIEATARLQVMAQKFDAADQSIQELQSVLGSDTSTDAAALRRAARLYLAMKKPLRAMELARKVRAMLPNDAESHLLMADVYLGLDKKQEARDEIKLAISRQPTNFRLRLALAHLLDADEKRVEALDVLTKLGQVGTTGMSEALRARGRMLASWGLLGPAAEAFKQLYDLGYVKSPPIRLELARSLAVLGKKDEAREEIKGIPPYSDAYGPAQLLAADLAEDTDTAVRILDDLAASKPGNGVVLVRKVGKLIQAKRYAAAAAAVKSATDAKKPVPAEAVALAVAAYVEENQRDKAAELCLALAANTNQRRWQQMAGLLLVDAKPDDARKLLPPLDRADAIDAVLGLCLAADAGDAAQAKLWQGRLTQLDKALKLGKPSRSLPVDIRLPAALAAGLPSLARQLLVDVRGAGLGNDVSAKELVDNAAKNPAFAAEASRLLKAQLALEMRVGKLARDTALAVLRARPTCQWAAMLALRGGGDDEHKRTIAGLVRPADAPIAQTLSAIVLSADGKHAEAAAVYDKLALRFPQDIALTGRQAMAHERMGDLDGALKLYSAILKQQVNPVAANNAAYLISQRHPQDKAKLAQAFEWAQAAAKNAPGMSQLLDTTGWIQYLQGSALLARDKLRRAVRMAPNSIENHYHLGVVEKANGSDMLARWHLEAVATLDAKDKADKVDQAPSTKEAVRLAAEALKKLPAPTKPE